MAHERSARWAFLGFAFRVAVAAFVVAALGFPVFVWSLARKSEDPQPADAIVALTGGEGRVSAALELLDQGKGKRLLISGVDVQTSRAELFDAAGSSAHAACCVDLGRSAANTIGNAGEAAAWVSEHDYRSIIVVTASYHMPRSLMELRAVLPETTFVPYPVFPESVRLDEWWHDGETVTILASEYLKFLAASVRVAIATGLGTKPAPLPGPATIENAPGEAPIADAPGTTTQSAAPAPSVQ